MLYLIIILLLLLTIFYINKYRHFIYLYYLKRFDEEYYLYIENGNEKIRTLKQEINSIVLIQKKYKKIFNKTKNLYTYRKSYKIKKRGNRIYYNVSKEFSDFEKLISNQFINDFKKPKDKRKNNYDF